MTHLTAFNHYFICTYSRALCACFSCKKYVSTWRHTLSQHYIHKTMSLRSVVSCFGADTIFICDIIMRFRFQTNERTLFDYMRCSFCMIFEICNIYDKIIPVLSEDLDAIVKNVKMQLWIVFYLLVSAHLLIMLPSHEFHRTLPTTSQHCLRSSLGDLRLCPVTGAHVALIIVSR